MLSEYCAQTVFNLWQGKSCATIKIVKYLLQKVPSALFTSDIRGSDGVLVQGPLFNPQLPQDSVQWQKLRNNQDCEIFTPESTK